MSSLIVNNSAKGCACFGNTFEPRRMVGVWVSPIFRNELREQVDSVFKLIEAPIHAKRKWLSWPALRGFWLAYNAASFVFRCGDLFVNCCRLLRNRIVRDDFLRRTYGKIARLYSLYDLWRTIAANCFSNLHGFDVHTDFLCCLLRCNWSRNSETNFHLCGDMPLVERCPGARKRRALTYRVV